MLVQVVIADLPRPTGPANSCPCPARSHYSADGRHHAPKCIYQPIAKVPQRSAKKLQPHSYREVDPPGVPTKHQMCREHYTHVGKTLLSNPTSWDWEARKRGLKFPRRGSPAAVKMDPKNKRSQIRRLTRPMEDPTGPSLFFTDSGGAPTAPVRRTVVWAPLC